jgi:hypothetical protein
MFKTIRTEHFKKKSLKLLSNSQMIRFLRFKERLKTNPYLGKPIKYQFLRELKLNNKRIYFLIYNSQNVILFIDISTKKLQQQTINKILELLSQYKNRF